MTHDRRLASIEDLLHTQQTTTSNILDRLKNVEVAVSNSNRAQAGADVVTQLQRDLAATKQRLEVVERSHKMDLQRLQDSLYAQQHSRNLSGQQSGHATLEISELRQNIAEVVKDVRKVDEAITNEARHAKQTGDDLKYVVEKLNSQFTGQKEQLISYRTKIEGVLKMVSMEVNERESLASSIKHAFEASLQGLDEHNVKRIEQEINQRVQLTNDVVIAFKKLRDEVAEGFQRNSEAQKDVEKALRAVESILKAEIRSRMQSYEAQKKQLASIEQRTANDSRVLVEGLKELDQTLNETRNTLSTEYKVSLEQLAGRVHDIQESLNITNDVVQALQEGSQSEVRGGSMSEAQKSVLKAELKKELRAEFDSSKSKLKTRDVPTDRIYEVQRAVDETRALCHTSVEALEREMREALESAAEERLDIVSQLKKGLEYERQQWETVVRRIQEDAAKKSKGDKEAFKHLRSEIKKQQRGDCSVGPSDLQEGVGGAELTALTDIVNELEIKVAAMSADTAGDKLEEKKYLGLLMRAGGSNETALKRLDAVESKVEEVMKKSTVSGPALEKEDLKKFEDRLKAEEQAREEGDHLLNTAVDELLRVYETQMASDHQTQIDELRASVLANTASQDEKYHDLTKLFEDQVNGCMKAHSEHERINRKQDDDIAGVMKQIEGHEMLLKDISS